MKDQRLEIKDIVKHIDDSTLGKLDIPEFQREFVWNPEKTKKLVDSLWRGYPIGIILLWESKYRSPKVAQGIQSQKLWIVDGQQRITSLSLLFGKKPYWWPDAEEWNKSFNKYNVLVNITSIKDSLEFALSNPIKEKSPEWVSVRDILSSDNLSELAEDISKKIGKNFIEVHEKLQSVKRIENYPLYELIIDHEVEDVAEIFTRLNMAGVKVRESDVVIALVAAKQEGWVREEFNPFLKNLQDKGFEIDPAILIRSLAVIGKGIARLKDIPEDFWEKSKDFENGWEETKESIINIVKQMNQAGILSSDILPSHNALIPLFAIYSKFKSTFNFKKALYWFLLATGDGRYSGSAVTILDQDIKVIKSSSSFNDTMTTLIKTLRISVNFTSDDFLRDYDDDFLRLIYYLMIFKNEAKDWICQETRIGYDRSDNQLNEGFKPEWHHFFPRAVLRRLKIDNKDINAFANIVVLNEKANKKFRSDPPEKYIKENNIKDDRFREQLIPIDNKYWKIEKYSEFLKERAKNLANEVTNFFKKLE